ncbi:MAG TPA: iron-containing redox enzyme family protein [Planctomycetota bacterium]|nr:iron-containing redox enzyme family protein [Planctomycetota bacterium]
MEAREFLKNLRVEVENHAGVGHSLLGRMTIDPKSRDDFRIMSEQHYPLVCFFTKYLELLLLKAPDSEGKTWLAKVLVDEYGEGSRGLDHAALYKNYMHAAGVPKGEERRRKLHPTVGEFILGHMRIVTEEPFLVGLGAVGPGHEWAIPKMFDLVISGLKKAGFDDQEIEYFLLHVEQDKDHGAWLEEALARYANTEESQAQIRRGAMLSLAAREQLWWGVADKIHALRMAERTPGMVPSTAASEAEQETLEQLEKRIKFRLLVSDGVTFDLAGAKSTGR